MAHEHDEGDASHDHSHEEVRFAGTEVDDKVLEGLRSMLPALAENLDLTRKFGELDAAAKQAAATTQRAIEDQKGWMPGYHADGDLCAGCSKPVTPLFTDTFAEGGRLDYCATLFDLPVHAEAACLDAARARFPRPAPQVLDRARRELVRVPGRPGARIAMFFRHDLLAHPPFGLEDWANSVAEANPGGLDRAMVKDIERLLMWVHARVYHS